MSLRAKSHSDLSAAARSPSDSGGSFKSFSVSGGGGCRLPNRTADEVKGLPRPAARRPVRAVRPLSAAGGSLFQINHLHGELVRKRKECEDLRRENKLLANEIHMERIVMRSESELTMRTLRTLNQELQAQVKELKQKQYHSQQRAALSSRAADEAAASRGEAERSRALAEARALGRQRDAAAAEADRERVSEELQTLKKEHTDLQLSLARAERGYFEIKLQLDRVSGENRALLQENRSLASAGDELRVKLGRITEENVQIKQSEAASRRRAAAAEDEAERAGRAQREAEARLRLEEDERRERTAESLSWREKHRELADRVRGHEDMKALRQSKASQANIKSYFLCMTESDQRVRILRNRDGSTRNFTEGDPVFIPGPEPEPGPEETERSSSRTLFRAPHGDAGQSLFHELPAFGGAGGGGGAGGAGGRPDSGPPRRSRKVVDYFWIPTDSE